MNIFNFLKKDSAIVILTGAGISAESGLATFRGQDGLWEGHKIEEVATPEAFIQNPDLVHSFYNQRRADLLKKEVKPNLGHKALAELEENWQGDFLLITQNIDNLHERAGNKNLLHMHGEALKAFCSHCGHKTSIEKNLHTEDICQNCNQAEGLRPDIVWFGEMPYHMEAIHEALWNCDLFISIGTSGNVYPASGFVNIAKANGAFTSELNLEPSENAQVFDESLYGPASKVIPDFVSTLFEKTNNT